MRRRTSSLATSLATSLALIAGACSEAPDDGESDGFVVPDGKADDFLSLKAREYVVSGTGRVVVEEGKTEIRARNLVAYEHTAITWFLNQYLVDKEKKGMHADPNHAYGGFSAMVKDGVYEDLKMTRRNAVTWDFEFEQIIAGRNDLMDKLPLDRNDQFDVEIGNPTNAEMERDAEWYRKPPWNAWDPALVPAYQKEALTLSIRPETRNRDAWWDYARLADNGGITIDVHFGYDYSPEKMHLTDSKSFYKWLLDRGFESPVASFDQYNRSSGPLTKTIDANGEDLRISIRIFYPRPGTSVDPATDEGGRALEADMLESLRTRDVIVYSGHSGPLYGFSLADWDKTEEGDLDDTELATAEMSRGKYQIVFAEGCNTYMLGNSLLKNPSKQGKDLDIITTTNSSVSYSPVQDFLARLLELDSRGRLRPRTMSQTIADLDVYTWGEVQPTMYGIHGVNDNPKLHPFSNIENMCKKCSTTSDCGGVGNTCATVDGSRRCLPACTDDAACGAGYKCRPVASSSTSTIYGEFCVPTDMSCN